MSEGQSPVEYEDMEAVQYSKSGKALGVRRMDTQEKLTWVPRSQLLRGSIQEVGDHGVLIIPQWLAESLAEEGRI